MSAKKVTSGLGRGFDVLIPTDFDSAILLDAKDRVQKLTIASITANPDQPRRHFDTTALNELASSIKQYGVLQPLILSPDGDGYRIIAGERRFRAAQIAGLTDVPAIVRDRHELEELEISIIENVQRVDLSPLEQAVSIERLHQQFNLSYKDIAAKLAKAETTISNLVRLLQLPESARNALQQQKISEGHARAILSLKNQPARQAELLKSIVKQGWSVRQAEQFVSSHREGANTKTAVKDRMATETPETKRLSKQFHAPVSIKRTAKGGRLEIHFKTDEELAAIVAAIESK